VYGDDDSDFIAAVWNPYTHTIDHIEYDSTRYGGHGSATPDATPDTITQAEAVLTARLAEIDLAQAHKDATTPTKGRRVRSTTKRGKNVGVEGIVMWRGEKRSQYGTWSHGYRVGIKVDGETRLRYLDETSVDDATITRHAARDARRHEWYLSK
jgi:hypothetical protein